MRSVLMVIRYDCSYRNLPHVGDTHRHLVRVNLWIVQYRINCHLSITVNVSAYQFENGRDENEWRRRRDSEWWRRKPLRYDRKLAKRSPAKLPSLWWCWLLSGHNRQAHRVDWILCSAIKRIYCLSSGAIKMACNVQNESPGRSLLLVSRFSLRVCVRT